MLGIGKINKELTKSKANIEVKDEICRIAEKYLLDNNIFNYTSLHAYERDNNKLDVVGIISNYKGYESVVFTYDVFTKRLLRETIHYK